MSIQAKGTKVVQESTPKRATGSQLYALVQSYRRRGLIASFGVDKDPKLRKAA